MKKNFTRTLYRLQARLSHRVNWRWLNNWKTLTGISLLAAGGATACREEVPERTPARFVFPDGVAVDLLALNNSVTQQSDIAYAEVEKEPIFPHGNVMAHINEGKYYPSEASKAGMVGKVLVGFTVNEKGKVENVRVLQGLHPALDSNAVEVVSKLPDFLPGRKGGKPVRVECSVPVEYTGEMMKSAWDAGTYMCYDVIDIPPLWKMLQSHICDNTRYPKEAEEQGIEGNVYVSVTVQPDGSLTNEHVVRGAHPLLDNEALRVVRTLTDWKPAYINRATVPETFVITVPFKVEQQKIYNVVKYMPRFYHSNPLEYIENHTQYPPEAKEQGIEGKVFVQFIIERNGEITNVKVRHPVHPLLDKEAMRIIREMPRWAPGMQNGEPVRVSYVLPVEFRLDK